MMPRGCPILEWGFKQDLKGFGIEQGYGCHQRFKENLMAQGFWKKKIEQGVKQPRQFLVCWKIFKEIQNFSGF